MPVVAIDLDESAGESQAALGRLRRNAEPAQALAVRHDMGLARQRRSTARPREVIAQGLLADRERNMVPGRAVTADVAACVERHPRRHAYRGLDVRAVEAHAAGGKRVDRRGVKRRMPVAGQVVPAQLVAHHEQHVAQRFSTGIRHASREARERGRFGTIAAAAPRGQ